MLPLCLWLLPGTTCGCCPRNLWLHAVCTETPKAQLLDIGTWPSSCANTKLGGSCEASCPAPYNGSPEVKCTASGWDTGVVGRCRNNTKGKENCCLPQAGELIERKPRRRCTVLDTLEPECDGLLLGEGREGGRPPPLSQTRSKPGCLAVVSVACGCLDATDCKAAGLTQHGAVWCAVLQCAPTPPPKPSPTPTLACPGPWSVLTRYPKRPAWRTARMDSLPSHLHPQPHAR